ncbi:MAG: succinate dehydrogenase, hydrophobic membrane anchor protein [Pseudomonadota bacterium]|jgi:succinate dehydrogenase / fumarate reductase membrane anchor subunit
MSDKQRIKGAGGGHGTGGFIAQRISAVALLFLGPWFIVSLALAARGGESGAHAFLTLPLNAGLAAAFVIAACWHMRIGMREIIEDYISRAGTRKALDVLNLLVAALAAIAGLYALAKISFGV